VIAAPAWAHGGWVSKEGRGKAGTHGCGGGALAEHCYTDSCDEFSDGLSVRAWAAEFGTPAGPLSWDPDGAGGECAHNKFTRASWERHRVCVEQPIGCSAPYVQHF
jgi:hypothetical protein